MWTRLPSAGAWATKGVRALRLRLASPRPRKGPTAQGDGRRGAGVPGRLPQRAQRLRLGGLQAGAGRDALRVGHRVRDRGGDGAGLAWRCRTPCLSRWHCVRTRAWCRTLHTHLMHMVAPVALLPGDTAACIRQVHEPKSAPWRSPEQSAARGARQRALQPRWYVAACESSWRALPAAGAHCACSDGGSPSRTCTMQRVSLWRALSAAGAHCLICGGGSPSQRC